MANTPHYFIAIPLPDGIKKRYSNWQNELKNELHYKQWPHKEDLHITLKFLGPVESEQLTSLKSVLNSIEEFSEFELNTGQLGYFGNPNKPRVLWAGVNRTEPLQELYNEVERSASEVGFHPENRTYSPHITLAKRWNGNTADINELKKKYMEQEKMTVDQVVIYRIYPGESPKYRVEETYKLKEGG